MVNHQVKAGMYRVLAKGSIFFQSAFFLSKLLFSPFPLKDTFYVKNICFAYLNPKLHQSRLATGYHDQVESLK
jgi:hypothetical protein